MPPLRPRQGDERGSLLTIPKSISRRDGSTTPSRGSVGNEASAGLGSVPGSCNTAAGRGSADEHGGIDRQSGSVSTFSFSFQLSSNHEGLLHQREAGTRTTVAAIPDAWTGEDGESRWRQRDVNLFSFCHIDFARGSSGSRPGQARSGQVN